MAEKFLIIDGSSLIHRAFFALPPLTTKKGLNTGAVYGFCNMLIRLLAEVKPTWLAIAFDKSRVTFRTEMYADYKAQRKETPGELSEQFPVARELLEALNIKVLELDGFEADDIIGTLAKRTDARAEVIIVTGDRDELQLIDERVTVFYTKRGISDMQQFDEAEFRANYENLAPLQLIDLKGLMGDTSDNIPGVPGVGPKTAMKLIAEYQSVENVLAHAEEVPGKSLREKLLQNTEQALLSKKLATIVTDAPVSLELDDYLLGAMKPEASALMRELEFRNLSDRFAALLGGASTEFSLFGEAVPLPEENEENNVVQIDSALAAKKMFAAFTATEKPVYAQAVITGDLPLLRFASLELAQGEQYYRVDEESSAWEEVNSWLADGAAPKILFEAKEIIKVCLCQKICLRGLQGDLALAAYLVEPGENSYSLQRLSERYLAKSAGSLADMEPISTQLHELLSEKALDKLYREIELPLAFVLAGMEVAGIAVDRDLLNSFTVELAAGIAELEEKAYQAAGEKFNLNSPKQLGVILFDKLKLPVIKKTKTGYSTDVSVLEELSGLHPLVDTILAHRQLAKLHSTYLEGLKPLINPVTQRIHTHFQQTVTVTGRLSSTQPNLQNIPVRTEIGKRIREMFVPGAGFDWLLSCDYSQVELRILAHIAQDELLLDSFIKEQDVHARTAAEVFGLPLSEVTPELRTKAKAVNFGIVYGISDYGLGRQLGISRNEAAEYIENYFKRYTGVKRYMEDIVRQAREKGYVETLFGRRRYLPDINHKNFNLRSFAERTAINTPIQGTAADIIKLAMIRVQEGLAAQKAVSRILLQVHDELVLEVTTTEREAVAATVKGLMEATVQFSVPLAAEVAWGKNWADAK